MPRKHLPRRLALLALAGAFAIPLTLANASGSDMSGAITNPVLVAAGDICVTSTMARAKATGDLIRNVPTAMVFGLGDESNETGTAYQYANCYDPTWGSFLGRTHAAVGNHDCMASPTCAPYYAYFGAAAVGWHAGYYSYDLANDWHLVVLNSQCSTAGGCWAGSPQEQWLERDLRAHAGKHILAIWHIPQFGSGSLYVATTRYLPFWRDLYAAHADLILNGHEHDYERFALQSPTGAADPGGIREIVVGTGGASSQPFGTIKPNSQVRKTGVFGVIVLTLQAHAYSWRFVSIDGSFTDSGTQATHS